MYQEGRKLYRSEGTVYDSDERHDTGKGPGELLLSLHASFHWQDHTHPLIGVDHHPKQEWQCAD